MQFPLVSIITPSFNQGSFIQLTIESVLSQEYPNLEYIVIDGASTDNTLEVLQGIDDNRLKWVSEPDSGQSNALNKGLKTARGEILAYLNSDDLLLPGAIEFTVNAFQQNADIDLIYGDCIYIDGDGKTIGKTFGEPFDLEQALRGRIHVPQQTAFWRRRVTDKIGLFDESLHYLMDVDYWFRLDASGFETLYLPGIRGGYRLHHSSKTVAQVEGFWREWEQLIDKYFGVVYPSADATEAEIQSLKSYLHMYTLYAPWSQGYRSELRPLIRSILSDNVPFRHRVLAVLMYADTYLNTSFANLLLNARRKSKEYEKSKLLS